MADLEIRSDEPQDGGARLRVAALGDVHVRENHEGAELRALIAEIGRCADVLVLPGDLTDSGTPREAEHLADHLRACPIPVVGVLGNHDCQRAAESPHLWALKIPRFRVLLISGGSGLRLLIWAVGRAGAGLRSAGAG